MDDYPIDEELFGRMLEDVAQEIMRLQESNREDSRLYLAFAMNLLKGELTPLTSIVFSPDGWGPDTEGMNESELREEASSFGMKLVARAYLEYCEREEMEAATGFSEWAWVDSQIMVIDVSETMFDNLHPTGLDSRGNFGESGNGDGSWTVIGQMVLGANELEEIRDHSELIRSVLDNIMVVVNGGDGEQLSSEEIQRLIDVGIPDHVPSEWLDD